MYMRICNQTTAHCWHGAQIYQLFKTNITRNHYNKGGNSYTFSDANVALVTVLDGANSLTDIQINLIGVLTQIGLKSM